MSDNIRIIDQRALLNLLTEIVRDNPGFVYPSPPQWPDPSWPWHKENDRACLYRRNDGLPGCIIGHVLDRLGILDYAEEWVGAVELMQVINDETSHISGIHFTDDAMRLAETVQMHQDQQLPWEEALDKTMKWNELL